MFSRRVFLATLLLMAILPGAIRAQDENTPINFSVWAGIEWYLPFSEKNRWGLFAEGYVKRLDFLKNPQGLFWRLGGSYFYGGIVYALDDQRYWRIETGYMFHSMLEAPESVEGRIRINHTWRITITGDIPLWKNPKS